MESESVFPTTRRQLSRARGPELAVLGGVILAVLGGVVSAGLAALDPRAPPASALAGVYAVEAALAAGLLAVMVRRRARSPRSYLVGAVLATGLLLTAEAAGIAAGVLALAGCVWGYLQAGD